MVTKHNIGSILFAIVVMIVFWGIVGWIAFSAIRWAGEQLFDSPDERVIPTLTTGERCLVDPDLCWAEFREAEDEWWERQAEDDRRLDELFD